MEHEAKESEDAAEISPAAMDTFSASAPRESTEILSKNAEQVRSSAAQSPPLVDNTMQPVVAKTAETVQLGRDTAKRVDNKEEGGWEPRKIAPYFAGSLGFLLLCIYLASWTTSDDTSKYNVDVSKIVAEKIQLPSGRHIAYVEQGASKEEAKHHVLSLHDSFSSRLLGLGAVNEHLLQKYAVRWVAYDRPGIGQSDPHVKRSMNSTAEDMADIADALGMGSKFWVVSHSGAAAYAWAALHYIPHRLAGVAMLSPLMSPYAKNITKEESEAMWAGLGGFKPTFQYARRFPSVVPGKLKSWFKNVNTYMKNVKKTVNSKDRALLETDAFGESWETAIRESIRSGDLEPQAQDIILQAQDWGFQLSDVRPKPAKKKSLFRRIFFFLGGSELPGFSGPIHIFHGTEDKLTPLVMSEYIKRVLPQVELHKLEGEGHFSWYFNCNLCHRELFKTLFDEAAGLEELDNNTLKSEDTATKDPVIPANTITKDSVKSEFTAAKDPVIPANTITKDSVKSEDTAAKDPVIPENTPTESTSKQELDDEPLKSLPESVHEQQPEGYFEHGPEKPEDGPLNDLTIAEKEAEKIALFKKAGKVPPIEPQIGISPAQYEQLQHEINEIANHEEL